MEKRERIANLRQKRFMVGILLREWAIEAFTVIEWYSEVYCPGYSHKTRRRHKYRRGRVLQISRARQLSKVKIDVGVIG